MSIIYALVARGSDSVLCSYSPHQGNFEQVAFDVLKRLKPSQKYGQYATAYYNFYSYCIDGYVFMVMTETEYEMRIAFAFLMNIQQTFFQQYPKSKRDTARTLSLRDFEVVLKNKIILFNDKPKVDKFAELQAHLKELEKINLRNLDLAIERGQSIELLVDKTRLMSESAYEINQSSKKIKWTMWLKEKKMWIAIVLLLVVIGLVIAWIAGAF